MNKDKLPWVLMLVGATAVGKTELSLQLAEDIGGEIISVDSRLFYRGMDIGTAKPSLQERERVPHHLIDISDPDENLSLSTFQKEAMRLISEIASRGKIPICVGGTGQYINALTQGWMLPEIQENIKLREILEKWADEIGRVELFNKFKLLDPIAAKKMEPNNLRRTVRALEVIFLTGKQFSKQRQKKDIPYKVFQIGLKRNRAEIFERVEKRVDLMIEQGFVEEVKSLLEKGYPKETRAFSAIGYSQLIEHINGEISLEDAVIEIKRKTRKFVRRQNTWFKPSDSSINWYKMDENPLEKIKSDLLSKRITK